MMTNDDAGDSIVEFSEEISSTERPNPLPPSEYIGEIREAIRKTSNTSGKQYAGINFYVDPQQYPADYPDGNPDGTILSYNRLSLVDSKMARFRIKEFFEKLGLPAPGRSLDLNTLIGVRARIRVGHRQYEGHPQAEIQSVSSAG